MRYIKKFERLGIIEELENIADDIISKLKTSKSIQIETNFRDKNVTIICDLVDDIKYLDKEAAASVRLLDRNENKFLIQLTSLKKSHIIHELKHIDYYISRDYKINKSFYLNHIGRDVSNKYSFLFKSKDLNKILLDILYLSDPDEFESYFNEIYWELKEILRKSDDNRILIQEYLNSRSIYIYYKHFYNDKFDIRKFFKNKKLNIFIEELVDKIDKFSKEENYDIDMIMIEELILVFF